jgi:hypothetical protein
VGRHTNPVSSLGKYALSVDDYAYSLVLLRRIPLDADVYYSDSESEKKIKMAVNKTVKKGEGRLLCSGGQKLS